MAADNDAFLARGFFDDSSPIAIRVFQTNTKQPLDEHAISSTIQQALSLRDRWFCGDRDPDKTTAYRLCHGEGDRVPGFVMDRYGDVAVIRLDGTLLNAWLDKLIPLLTPRLRERGMTTLGLRSSHEAQGKKFKLLWGQDISDPMVVKENGMMMEVNLLSGQKTGAFLDQRDNRKRIRKLAEGRCRVLNLFSYTGGFSLAAVLGGAKHVTSVDTASAAHASAQRSFRLNGVDPTQHDFVTADVFDYLNKARTRGARFDLVISDPPSFAPNERAKGKALGAYRKLHTAIASILDHGGILCAGSCSSHVGAEEFLATLDDATLTRDDLRLTALYGQPIDHPTLPAWPEGRYLKFAVLS